MKRGIYVASLEIDTTKPLVFDVPVPASARLIKSYAVLDRGKVISPGSKAKIVPTLIFEVNVEDPEEKTTRIYLVPAGDGWIAEDSAIYRDIFLSPIDGCPIAVYESDPPAFVHSDEREAEIAEEPTVGRDDPGASLGVDVVAQAVDPVAKSPLVALDGGLA